jgi:hypothetical protein
VCNACSFIGEGDNFEGDFDFHDDEYKKNTRFIIDNTADFDETIKQIDGRIQGSY